MKDVYIYIVENDTDQINNMEDDDGTMMKKTISNSIYFINDDIDANHMYIYIDSGTYNINHLL